jgi:hypothetical protein
MGAGVKPAGSDASLLPKEVGVRLKQLRLEAGLTQSGMKQAVIALFAEMERKGELD